MRCLADVARLLLLGYAQGTADVVRQMHDLESLRRVVSCYLVLLLATASNAFDIVAYLDALLDLSHRLSVRDGAENVSLQSPLLPALPSSAPHLESSAKSH